MEPHIFTLHHRIARPVSVHHHKPTAALLQHLGTISSLIFMGVLAWLIYLAYTTLAGAPFSVLLLIIAPIKAAIIVLAFFLYYKGTFKRELHMLEARFRPKLAHGYRHL
jgi:hypothetical protein